MTMELGWGSELTKGGPLQSGTSFKRMYIFLVLYFVLVVCVCGDERGVGWMGVEEYAHSSSLSLK